MTFGQIKARVAGNLADANTTFYSEEDLIDSLQDGYDDIAFQAKCIIKKAIDIPFRVSPYYDFSLYIPDFLQLTAIFNNNTNCFLDDNLSLRDFDKLRSDWELWVGTPQWWCPADLRMNVILPFYSTIPSQSMDVYYNAMAPVITDDSETPLIAGDMQKLLEWYCTGDLLEQAEEFTKASAYFSQYNSVLAEYKERCQLAARRDLLITI